MAKKGYSLGSLADYVDTKVNRSGDQMTGALGVPYLTIDDGKGVFGTSADDVFIHNTESDKFLQLRDDGYLTYQNMPVLVDRGGGVLGDGLKTFTRTCLFDPNYHLMYEFHAPGKWAGAMVMNGDNGNIEFWQTNGGGAWAHTYGGWQRADGTFWGAGNADFNDVFIRSDERLKTDRKPLSGALEKVCRLQGYTYTKHKSLSDDTVIGREAGILAQDLEKVLPEATHTAEDTQMTISNSGVNALLVEAVKELRAEVMELRALLEGK